MNTDGYCSKCGSSSRYIFNGKCEMCGFQKTPDNNPKVDICLDHDINCPYCGSGMEIDHSVESFYGWKEGVKHEMECCECGKSFVFETRIMFHYKSSKADCLNGKPHNYKKTHTFPVEFAEMECVDCGHRRPLTEEEK